MTMEDILERIKELINPVLQEDGAELVEIIFRREAGQQVLRLLVDKEGGIQLADCVRLNERISQVLDESNIMTERYLLEVNSPGIDRPFKVKRDYERAINRPVRVTLSERIQDKKEYIGVLEEVSDIAIKIDVKKKGIINIPFDKITRAREEVEFD